MKIQHNYSGKSLLELREEFGVGEGGFYNNEWWLKEPFAKEKLKAGIYEIDFEKNFLGIPYEKQKLRMKTGFGFPHPAVLAEAILDHYKKTGERLLKDWWSRTSSVDSVGYRVSVGVFVSGGLDIFGWDVNPDGDVGVASARKLESLEAESLKPLESLKIEIKEVEINGKIYRLK